MNEQGGMTASEVGTGCRVVDGAKKVRGRYEFLQALPSPSTRSFLKPESVLATALV